MVFKHRVLLHACMTSLAGCLHLIGKPIYKPSHNASLPHNMDHNASLPHKMDPEELPAELQELGLRLFGTKIRLASVLDSMSWPELVSIEGVEMKLVHARGDDTMQRFYGANEDRNLLKHLYDDDSFIIDVGANVGDYAILAALLNPKLQIVAIEPVPTTFFYLAYNVHLNKLTNLTAQDLGDTDKPGIFLVHAAVGNSDGESEVGYSDKLSKNAGVNVSHNMAVGWKFERVPQLNLYNFLMSNTIFIVNLLKMDCEGCEFSVIPQLGDFFVSTSQVHKFTGEIHRSLTDPHEQTFVEKPSENLVQATNAQLKKRGCKTNTWAVSC